MCVRGFEAKFRHCVMAMISFYVFLCCCCVCVCCRRGDFSRVAVRLYDLFMSHLAQDKSVFRWNQMELIRREEKHTHTLKRIKGLRLNEFEMREDMHILIIRFFLFTSIRAYSLLLFLVFCLLLISYSNDFQLVFFYLHKTVCVYVCVLCFSHIIYKNLS